ncbi:MAG: SRPBCC domain-containing protein [Acidobacteriota bacterium]|nr:SRPBCC domain-containing protein [Acidobacteriota bacterium]
MTQGHIERELSIDAPIDVVWATITEPEQINEWWTDTAQIDLHPGGDGRLGWVSRATNEPMTVPLRVERFEPPHHFSFRWCHPDAAAPTDANSLLVEFSLTSDGQGTRLRLVESGFDTREWTAAERDAELAKHEDGWTRHLATLRQHAASVAVGAEVR